MNKTRKLTQGAMLLAIIGAAMLIDRQLSFFFTEFILLLAPIVIIIYSCMYTVKDGAILSVCLMILTILFGSLSSYIYMPIGMIVGLGFGLGVNRNLDRRKLNYIAIILYIIGEVIATFIIYPLLGLNVAEQVSEIGTALNDAGLLTAVESLNLNISTFLITIYIASTIITGILEGYLTCLLSTLLLKRLKIKNIGISSILDIKISPIASYILFGLSVLTFINFPVIFKNNEMLIYIIMCVSIMASLVLAYYGYIFLLVYLRISFGKKALIFVILFIFLLFPLSYFVLVIVGFLYGSGPFRSKLEERLALEDEKNEEE